MKAFFSNEVGLSFEPFGLWHMLVLLLVIGSVFSLLIFRKKIRRSKYEQSLRITLGVLGILFEIALHAWAYANGIWTYTDNFPIAVCFFALAMGIYVMFTKSRAVFDVGYYWAIGGMVSILFPDIPFGPDRFRFYQFLFSHMLFFLMFLYMVFVHQYRPTFRGFVKSVVILFVITYGVVLPIDWLTGANFLFLVDPKGTPFEIVSGHGYVLYVVGTFVFGLLVMVVWYLPICVLNIFESKIDSGIVVD
jgi:hypothetical integral membrane protein (TIGR02206 family)